ncbi:MAG: 50S ribosomal protein L6 [Bdellovibrionaceae bacterium]|jgi:large subunit ribosomal protein L6|nr:50S ribosomal protein L6 [Pseudobdellovibrionaceae bacterium]
MSRVGKVPVIFSEPVKVTVSPNGEVVIKGAKAEQRVQLQPSIKANIEEGQIVLTRESNEPKIRAYHGLYRALIQNAVTGVSTGWSKSLILNGVGYRASVSGKKLEMNLGYSHPIIFEIPAGIEIKVEKSTTIHVNGSSRELVGQVAAKIRGYREPEPFLGKGVRYSDEVIRRKAGKSAGK